MVVQTFDALKASPPVGHHPADLTRTAPHRASRFMRAGKAFPACTPAVGQAAGDRNNHGSRSAATHSGSSSVMRHPLHSPDAHRLVHRLFNLENV